MTTTTAKQKITHLPIFSHTMSPTNSSDDMKLLPPFPAPDPGMISTQNLESDIRILTSGGHHIPAHSSLLASASPVLGSIIASLRENSCSANTIQIFGVPYDAVSVFVGFLYTSMCAEEEMEKFGIHLLALSHVYLVPKLKRRCTKALAQQLTVENVVDVLQLTRLCDAPDLYFKSMKLIDENFKAVEHTEGWQFLQQNDPFLELEILQFIEEAELRKKNTKKHREDQSLYLQLSEALESLEHICTEGCTSVGPHDIEPSRTKGPCSRFSTCEGLQHSIRHFAACQKKVNGGCLRCTRFWQLLKLHSSICDNSDICRVPMCREFKTRTELQKKRKDITRWDLLAKKVMSARVISSLSVTKKKIKEEPRE
ncbi:BTB/POZ and TAZ domain-containing protein 1 [Daucus carota subsp. sativus]